MGLVELSGMTVAAVCEMQLVVLLMVVVCLVVVEGCVSVVVEI